MQNTRFVFKFAMYCVCLWCISTESRESMHPKLDYSLSNISIPPDIHLPCGITETLYIRTYTYEQKTYRKYSGENVAICTLMNQFAWFTPARRYGRKPGSENYISVQYERNIPNPLSAFQSKMVFPTVTCFFLRAHFHENEHTVTARPPCRSRLFKMQIVI